MNSVDAGKHNSSFNWYSGKSDSSSYKGSIVTIPITETTSAERLVESPRISEVRQNASPLVDSIRKGSPKEPSRINKPIFASSKLAPHVAHKHPHPSDDLTSSPLIELPLKRLKVDQPSLSPSPSSLDYNTLNGSDIIDFKFSTRVPSEIIALEEAERADRLKRRANPVLLGKFSRLQKELIMKANPQPTLIKEASDALIEKGSGIVESVIVAKDAILEKGQSLIESTKEAIGNINMHPLRQSLNEIAQEATPIPAFRPLLPLGETEQIEFVWPRVSGIFKAGEESERTWRMENKPSSSLFRQWKSINAEILSKWNTSNPGFIFAKKIEDSSIVGKASKAIEDVLQFTTEKIEQFSIQGSTHDIEWFRLQEEKERARRINESPLVPSSKRNKALVDQQLLDVARRIRNQQ